MHRSFAVTQRKACPHAKGLQLYTHTYTMRAAKGATTVRRFVHMRYCLLWGQLWICAARGRGNARLIRDV